MLDVAEREGDSMVVSFNHISPLMMGAGLGQVDVVRVLLRNNADKAMRDDDGDAAIDHARNKGHAEIVKLLGS